MLALVLIFSTALQDPVPKPEQSAEQTLRTFFVAIVTHDSATLRSVTVPSNDFDWLLRSQPLPADQVEGFKAQAALQPIRVLKPGDEVTLPGGRKVTVRPEEVTADRAVLLPQGSPIPTRLRKVDGRWRVDASPIIAARKAADAARNRATPPKDQPK